MLLNATYLKFINILIIQKYGLDPMILIHIVPVFLFIQMESMYDIIHSIQVF